MSDYAWIIDQDHLSGPGAEFHNAADPDDCIGVIGPRDAKGEDKDSLTAAYAHHHQFRMYDDDDILYVTGTLFWDGDADNPEEHQVYGPLSDYGEGGTGCVSVRYTGRPGWDCG